jgi:hypothetical protein
MMPRLIHNLASAILIFAMLLALLPEEVQAKPYACGNQSSGASAGAAQ